MKAELSHLNVGTNSLKGATIGLDRLFRENFTILSPQAARAHNSFKRLSTRPAYLLFLK